MPPPNDTPAYHLVQHPRSLFIFQLDPKTPIPATLLQPTGAGTTTASFKSITWTHEEISVVCEHPPRHFPELNTGSESLVLNKPEDWECAAFSIRGPMELTLTGILSGLIAPLKEAGIPIFTVSTWNTDFLLIPIAQKGKTIKVLRQDGWTVED
ncbi:hypothetical protein M408DRAFT_63182 [Serendipita vermifera MAFF 305830]|uniref:CASTOR ACT domain-containing protein n=1 Tax=Serendipita vermifera MAFF 305830 TaxID=933852 RepID=A0A0C3BLY8_SERVB|nr:hypothetical protein M408DRAFT_63182 [Serendipita vermifera MAFF 305830]